MNRCINVCVTGGVMAIALALPLTARAAQAAYVGDRVVAGVYATASASDDRIAELATGDKVEVETREQGFTQVRLADGREGWIETKFLSDDPPAAARLATLQSELQKLRAAAERDAQTSAQAAGDAKRVAELQKALDAARSELAARAKPAAASPAGRRDVAADDELPIEPIGADLAYRRTAWIWGTVAALAALGIGFLLGWRLLDRKVRARYGGLRIY
jgi:hypothetical protein